MANTSPLEQYCAELDFKHADKTYMWIYYNVALQVDKSYFTSVLLNDIKWRANHQRNVVASVEGQQGCGKSLFSIALANMVLSPLFGHDFDIKRDLYINPSDLDYELRNGTNRRRTFIYDEQPQRYVGTGSRSTQIGLKDYEEICRYTQNNLIYCSPEVYDHAHYFIFKQVEFDPPRVHNKKCVSCPDYSECQKDFYSTKCDIPFYRREGYPKRFNFLLETKRLADKMFMPRGIVSLPMIPHELATEYNKVKGVNIKKFEKYESDVWKKQLKEIDDFVEENKKELITKTQKGLFKPQSKEFIRLVFFKHFGKNRFVTADVETFIAFVKQKMSHRAEMLNNEEEH